MRLKNMANSNAAVSLAAVNELAANLLMQLMVYVRVCLVVILNGI